MPQTNLPVLPMMHYLTQLPVLISQTPLSAKKLKDGSPCHRDQMVEDSLTIKPMSENLNILPCLEV